MKTRSGIFVTGLFSALVLVLAACTLNAGDGDSIQAGTYASPNSDTDDSVRFVTRIVFEGSNYELGNYRYLKTHPNVSGEWKALVSVNKRTGSYTLTPDSLRLKQQLRGNLEAPENGTLSASDVEGMILAADGRTDVLRIRNVTSTSFQLSLGTSDAPSWTTFTRL